MKHGVEERGFLRVLERPYTALLVTLLGILAAYPFLEGFAGARFVVTVAILFVMAAALYASRAHRRVFIVGTILAAATVLGSVVESLVDVPFARPTTTALELLFMGVLALSIFRDVLSGEEVTMESVFGACSVYLMLALCWTGIYELLDLFSPGAFDYGGLSGVDQPNSFSKLAYFSVITMTTVGYGDVTPVSAPARSLAALEGVVGQLYIAVVIARLVAMEMSHRMKGGS
jgi:hypothetical protein